MVTCAALAVSLIVGLLMLRLVGQAYVQQVDLFRAAPHEEPMRRLGAFMQSTSRGARAVSAGGGPPRAAHPGSRRGRGEEGPRWRHTALVPGDGDT